MNELDHAIILETPFWLLNLTFTRFENDLF